MTRYISNQLTNQLTPWSTVLEKLTNSSVCQEIPHILWPPKYHNSVHNGPILSQIYPVHAFPSYFLKIHFNVLHLRPGLPSCLPPSGVPNTFIFPLTLATSPQLLFLITRTLYDEEKTPWGPSRYSLLQFLVTPLRPKWCHLHFILELRHYVPAQCDRPGFTPITLITDAGINKIQFHFSNKSYLIKKQFVLNERLSQ